jgi:hypothetical protein
MPGVEQITVPATLTLFLAWAFDKIKPWLGQFGPFKQENPKHADNLRALFFGICAVAVLIFALVSGLAPHDFDAGLTLLWRILTTAGLMTAGGHVVYGQLSGAASEKRAKRATAQQPSDPDLIYPPSNYDGGGDLRASAQPVMPTLSAEPPAQ